MVAHLRYDEEVTMVGMLVHGFGTASKVLNVCNGTVEQLALDRFPHLFGLESEMIGGVMYSTIYLPLTLLMRLSAASLMVACSFQCLLQRHCR